MTVFNKISDKEASGKVKEIFDEIKEAWDNKTSIGEFKDIVLNLPFYKALLFTLTFCFAVTPPVIILGFRKDLEIITTSNEKRSSSARD